jgi:hypothetical protein
MNTASTLIAGVAFRASGASHRIICLDASGLAAAAFIRPDKPSSTAS